VPVIARGLQVGIVYAVWPSFRFLSLGLLYNPLQLTGTTTADGAF